VSKENLLLTLLVHRYSREQYHQKHDLHVEKQKKWLEGIRQESFDALPKDRQSQYLDQWFWPPWRFNNIVGFAEIELETDSTVIGHLYLPEGRYTPVKKKSLLLNYACASAQFEPNNLNSLRQAIIEVEEQMQSIVAKRRWILEFDEEMVKYTDFLKMINERRKRKSNE
jgi:hypothetical protein